MINVATAIIKAGDSERTAFTREITGSSMGRGFRCMSPGVSASKPRPSASGTSTAKLIQRICIGFNGVPSAIVQMPAPTK
jgi:hypothetical protein